MDQSYKEKILELQRIARAADAIDRERMEFFRGMLKHPGWAVYQELLNIRIQIYADAVTSPAGSVDGAIALEWVKGAMSGVILARDLPTVTIAGMEATVPATDGDDE